MKLFFVIFIFLLNANIFAQDRSLHISFGDVQVAESRVQVNLEHFSIVNLVESKRVKVKLLEGSVQWVRDSSNLLIPRAMIRIEISNPSKEIHVSNDGETYLPQTFENAARIDLYINLFNPGIIEVKEDEYTIGKYTLFAQRSGIDNGQLIDYSCSAYDLNFKGLDKDYLSVGCVMERFGKIGSERPRLMITWASTNYTLKDGTRPPFRIVMQENAPVHLTLVDSQGKEQEVTITARLPKRLHRLKTAFGAGPYMFESKSDSDERNDRLSAAAMLYGRYDLVKGSSFRIFDAIVAEKSIFNNAGLYFAYEIADIFDGRIEIVPLLGLQALYFKYDDNHPTRNGIIYPQGLEVVYKNAFGMMNTTMSAGAFFLSTSDEKYQNLWIRIGKKVFWELNYISWKADQNRATMAGLSIGFPLFQLF